MRQLLLDLLPDNPPTLNNFVAGRDNGETLAALTLWLTTAVETSFCLYGLPGSGCSPCRTTKRSPPSVLKRKAAP